MKKGTASRADSPLRGSLCDALISEALGAPHRR